MGQDSAGHENYLILACGTTSLALQLAMLDKYSWLTDGFLSQIAEIYVLNQYFSVKAHQKSGYQPSPDSNGEKVYDLRWVPYVFICLPPR